VLADGRRFRVLVVVDDFTRECLALVVDTSISGRSPARRHSGTRYLSPIAYEMLMLRETQTT
jgi:hypothetical protein